MTTYSVIVEDERVLIFVEIVQRALWDAIFYLNGTLDVLLFGELNLLVDDIVEFIVRRHALLDHALLHLAFGFHKR